MFATDRGPLLAGMAALLALCTAGCQSSSVNQAPFAAPAAADAQRPLFTGQAPPPAAAPRTTAVLLPVPTASAAESREVIASSWQPVRRVSAEYAPGSEPGVLTLAAGGPMLGLGGAGSLPPGETVGVMPLPSPRLVPQPAPGPGPHPPMIDTLPPAPPVAGPAHPAPPPVPKECMKEALPPYVIEPPDILLVESAQDLPTQPIRGQHLVRPDGTIELGIYGTVFVTGMTVEQARQAIAAQLSKRIKDLRIEYLSVDVLAYNSKYYYVIADGGGWGQQIYRFPVTGNETVLDALAQIGGLPPVAAKNKIWVSRPECHDPAHPKVLPVDLCGIVRHGSAATNYQLYPGDRIFVQSDCMVRTDTYISKFLSPIQRLFGATLLGASTVNTIKFGSRGLGGTGIGGVGGVGLIR